MPEIIFYAALGVFSGELIYCTIDPKHFREKIYPYLKGIFDKIAETTGLRLNPATHVEDLMNELTTGFKEEIDKERIIADQLFKSSNWRTSYGLTLDSALQPKRNEVKTIPPRQCHLGRCR